MRKQDWLICILVKVVLIFLASIIDFSVSETKAGSGIGHYSKYRPKGYEENESQHKRGVCKFNQTAVERGGNGEAAQS